MRVPVSWLKEYVDITMPIEELAEMLTLAGLEVENIDYIGIPGGDDAERLVWDREKLVIGQILKVEQHPNADRLVLATVEYGAAEPEVVVTGAPNLFQFVGQGELAEPLYSPFALEGAEVYDGHKEGQVKMILKGRELRGIYNKCMVCSAKELGLGEDHDGVMLLRGAGYVAGAPLQDVLGDAVLEIDIIPNIARCASMVGVAREVAALTGQQVRYPSFEVLQEGESIQGRVVISTQNPSLNPRFVALLIENVDQSRPTPLWMRRRLELAGQRPINVVVDISNYVMLEMGEPNHTFDYDYMRQRADQYDPNGPIHIITRLAKEGETIVTLDGQKRELPDFTILVTDPLGNLSIGGIMGGENSEINDGTRNVLLEAAAWNYINIRRSAHALKLNSEAGFRFSRGVHPSQALLGAKRAAELLRKYAGGTVAQGIVDYYPQPAETVVIDLDPYHVERLSGLVLSKGEIAELLERPGFRVEEVDDKVRVTVPDYRIDIDGWHDLVEEICRMYGYDRLPATVISDTLPPQRNNPELDREERIRDALVGLGLQEIITYRLTSTARENKLLATTRPDDRPYVTLANPISADRVAMRHNLLASVAEIAAENSKHSDSIALFELGKIYIVGEDGALPEELPRLAIVMTGEREEAYWQNGHAPQRYDFFDIKGIVESMVAVLNVDGVSFEADEHPSFRPGRTARLKLFDKPLGWLGELHPLVVERLDIRSDGPVLAADVYVDVLMRKMRDSRRLDPISIYPPVVEDIAVIVDRGVTAAAVTETIVQAGGSLLKNVALFDVYEGGSIPAGKRSLAYHLTFQAPNKTLKDKDVKKIRSKIVSQLAGRFQAKLRE